MRANIITIVIYNIIIMKTVQSLVMYETINNKLWYEKLFLIREVSHNVLCTHI